MTRGSSANGTPQTHKDPRDMAPRAPRPLGAAHFQWWRSAHGLRYEAAAPPSVLREPPQHLIDGFFNAIRDNHVHRVKDILAVCPHLVLTKCFGVEQRTALYTASFFARHKIVSLLLECGADRRLCSEGVQASAVVGYGRRSAVDEMKVRCLLSEGEEIHILILTAEEEQAAHVSSASRRIHVHFSESVHDFIQDDIQTENCTIERFTRLGGDFYAASVRLAKRDSPANAFASIQVPCGVINAPGDHRVNAASNVLKLKLA